MPEIPTPTPRTRRVLRPRIPAALAALLGALAIALAVPTSASAHDQLISSDPADGASLEAPPEAITLTFNDAPLDVSPQIRVTGPDGAVVADGAPTIEGTAATLALPDGLPTGTSTVQWRVVSTDGHPIEGSFSFDVAQGTMTAGPDAETMTALAEPTSSAAASDSPSPSALDDDDAASTGVSLAAILLAVVPLVAIVGIALALLARRGTKT